MEVYRCMPCGFYTICGLLFVMTFSAHVTSLKHKNMICDKLQDCVCGFPSGQGVNLTSLGTEPVILNDTVNNLIFYFNPCVPFLASCSNTSSICVIDSKANNTNTTSLGSQSGGTFTSQGLDGPIYLDYRVGSIGTEIHLECSNKNESTLQLVNDSAELEPDPDIKYHLLLQSPSACLRPVDYVNDVSPGSISSGALFFLVVLIVFCSYLLIGAAANHFLRGATGWEMIPHYIMWRNLLTFFSDFLKFIANGCQSPPSYEQI